MTTTYGTFIKQLREEREVSQAEMANRLGISRSSYVAIEKGTKELSLSEAEAIAHIFGMTVDELVLNQKPNYTKYRQMILAYLRAAKKDGKKLKKTKLAKLLYLADFAWYYEHLESMSGMPYRRISFGPVPNEYFTALEALEREGYVTVTKHKREDGTDMYELAETRASERMSLDTVTSAEEKLMKEVWQNWRDANTEEIVRFTHEQLPYKLSFDSEIIPYELITQEDPDNVY